MTFETYNCRISEFLFTAPHTNCWWKCPSSPTCAMLCFDWSFRISSNKRQNTDFDDLRMLPSLNKQSGYRVSSKSYAQFSWNINNGFMAVVCLLIFTFDVIEYKCSHWNLNHFTIDIFVWDDTWWWSTFDVLFGNLKIRHGKSLHFMVILRPCVKPPNSLIGLIKTCSMVMSLYSTSKFVRSPNGEPIFIAKIVVFDHINHFEQL